MRRLPFESDLIHDLFICQLTRLVRLPPDSFDSIDDRDPDQAPKGNQAEERLGILAAAHREDLQQAYRGMEEHRERQEEGRVDHQEKEMVSHREGAWEGRWDREGMEA